MLIGMGGGAASSMATGANTADLDFDSVQRGNAEIAAPRAGGDRPLLAAGRRAIRSCRSTTSARAACRTRCRSSCTAAARAARFDLRAVPSEEPGMAPREIWCNEAQERYVLAIAPATSQRVRGDLRARALPVRRRRHGERATSGSSSPIRISATRPVDMELDVLLGKPPKMTRDVAHVARALPPLDLGGVDCRGRPRTACCSCPRSPTRRSSSRSATAPSAACARAIRWSGRGRCRSPTSRVTLMDFDGYAGEAMAMGERTPLALIDAPASGRMAVGEAITNIAAARHRRRLSRRQALRQLDGAGRASRRGRRALRHGARGGDGAVPGARRQHSGRQGFDVDAHDVAATAAARRR